MGLLTAIGIMAVSFLAYVLLRSVSPVFADVYLFVLFIFAFIVSNKEFSVFYLLLFVIAIIIDLAMSQFAIQPANSAFGFKGFGLTLVSLAMGLGIYLVISVISVRVGGNIVGAPELAVSTSEIAQNLRPTFVSHLGIIENRIAFAFFEVLNIFGAFIPFVGLAFQLIPYVVPTIIIGFIMGLFHVAAYSVAFSLLLWASMAFMLFIASYLIMNRDSLGSDTAHFLNNGILDVNRGLSISI